MANPQPTDAHIRIAHSIHEQIMMSMFSERQIRVLLFILRLSWGCGKHSAYIPRQKDFELCGVGEGHIKNILNWLIIANVIIREGDYYQFNKDFDRWHVSRCPGYSVQKLTELVRLNLKTPDQDFRELTESVSQNLPKREETTYRKGKFPTPELATAKEIYKEIYKGGNREIEFIININLITGNSEIKDEKLFICGQGLQKSIEIAIGILPSTKLTQQLHITELDRLGVDWRQFESSS